MSNKVTYGFSNLHIAFLEGGAYETPIKIPGAIQWTPTTRGDKASLAADNLASYFEINTNNGYTADVVVANIPDEVIAEMLGWEIDSKGGLVEIADGKPKKFALGFQVEGDSTARKTWYYDVLASRPAKEHQTQGESTTFATDQLSMTVSPVEIGGKKTVKYTLPLTGTNKTEFDGFFSTVTEPVYPVTP